MRNRGTAVLPSARRTGTCSVAWPPLCYRVSRAHPYPISTWPASAVTTTPETSVNFSRRDTQDTETSKDRATTSCAPRLISVFLEGLTLGPFSGHCRSSCHVRMLNHYALLDLRLLYALCKQAFVVRFSSSCGKPHYGPGERRHS